MEDTLHGPVRGFQAYYLPHPTPRLAGAPDISPCPQSRKDVLFAKAHEVFRNTSNVGEYYYLIRPYLGEHCPVPPLPLLLLITTSFILCATLSPKQVLCLPGSHLLPLGGAPLEELQYLAHANISMDIDTFTNLNPLTLKVGPGATSVLFLFRFVSFHFVEMWSYSVTQADLDLIILPLCLECIVVYN